jgi:hypothetical protein
MARLRPAFAVALLLLVAGAPALLAQRRVADEEFTYRWQLRNLIGTIAGLFLPNQGEGSLIFKKLTNGHMTSELTITSNASKAGEYFRYGSEMDLKTLQPIRAWSSYSWRGESKSKSDEIEEAGVLDIASGIFSIRQNPPVKPRRMQIWSDGKVYPVLVIPLETSNRRGPDGKSTIEVRHYSIRGIDLPDQRKWKGKLDLWLAKDDVATPVEILISRNLADVRMELKAAH